MSETPLKLGEERIAANEDALIKRIAEATLQGAAFVSVLEPRRLPHPKSHGCVEGLFVVDADIGTEYSFGVFKPDLEYRCWIRFSNADPRVQDDNERDIRGMAIKLNIEKLDREESDEQDFILANDKVFFSPNAMEFGLFSEALTKFKGLDRYLETRPRIQRIYTRSQVLMRNPLERQYFSQVPFKLGDGRAVKYSVRPSAEVPVLTLDTSENFLRNALVDHFKQQEARFDFLVQLQTDPEAMPVEDATVEWPEAVSPYKKVATIIIPPQTVGNCERMAFNPWRGLPEHRPLGIINRIRQAVYERAAAIRLRAKTQQPFMAMMTLQDPVGGAKKLRKILKENGLVNAFTLHGLGFVHSARFVILEDEIAGQKLTRFAVITTFDFDFPDYVQSFVDQIGDVFDELLELMKDAPPRPVRSNRQAFLKYLQDVSAPYRPVLFYSAYPDLSVKNISKLEKHNV